MMKLSPESSKVISSPLKSYPPGWCYYESGVRELRRCLEKIARIHAKDILVTYEEKYPRIEESKPTEETKTEEPAQDSPIANQTLDFGKAANEEDAQKLKNKDKETPQQPQVNPQQIAQINEVRNSKKLTFELSKDPEDNQLKKYLGMPLFDDMYERKHKKPRAGNDFSLKFNSK
jgi:hypothetical protein